MSSLTIELNDEWWIVFCATPKINCGIRMPLAKLHAGMDRNGVEVVVNAIAAEYQISDITWND